MLEESGTVVNVEGTQACIETVSRSSCAVCSSGTCSTSVVSRLFGLKRNRLVLDNTQGARVGDRVVIGIPDAVLVKASIWAYLVPVLAMVILTGLAQSSGAGDLAQALCALIGLAGGFYLVRWITGRDNQRQDFDPVMLRIERRGKRYVEMPVPGINES